MPTVLLPSLLHAHAEGRASVEVEGSNLNQVMRAVVDRFPALAPYVWDGAANAVRCVVQRGAEVLESSDAPLPSQAVLTLVLPVSSLPELSHGEVERYSRHLILDEVGIDGQRRLKGSAVLCVGTGGLGSPLLMYLAAAGVGRIGIVDFDVVDRSNLQRQVIHGTEQVGRKKVDSARDRIHAINEHVQVDVYEEALTSENALRICAPYDVVVDGTDNFPTRYLVNDACVILGKPNVYGSIFRFEGQASVFNYRGGPNYRDLYPNPPPPGMVPSCAEGGVLGILPGVIGVIQATETVKILLGLGTSLSGRLLLYDALHMRFHELALQPDPNAKAITDLVDYEQFCGFPATSSVAQPDIVSLQPREVEARRAAGWCPYVLDVRRASEVAIAALPFVDRVCPHGEVAAIADRLPRDRDILVHCKSGVRSAKAIATLSELGFDRLFNLDGGINAWARDVDPDLPTY